MKYKTAFRLALRAIGVFIMALQLPNFVQLMVSTATQIHFSSTTGLAMNWPLAALAQYLTGLLIGLYLFFGGQWIIQHAIPSNRPYCHECGYDLTGSPPEGECPECGTAYRKWVSRKS